MQEHPLFSLKNKVFFNINHKNQSKYFQTLNSFLMSILKDFLTKKKAETLDKLNIN